MEVLKKTSLQAKIAMLVLFLIVGASVLAPVLACYNPFEPDMASRLQAPSWNHLFGTDALGRDMFSRILYGGRVSMMLSLIAALLSLLLGLVVGLLAGFYGGRADALLTAVSNVFQGIPSTCFMIAIAGILGPSIHSLIIALVIVSWVGFSRIVRAEVIQLKNEPFVEGLYCIGCSDFRIIVRHILPNIFNKLFILFTIRVGRGILAVAGLSFLGLGVQPPTPDWSVMITDASMYYRSSPHLILIPGICIFLLVYSINIIGESICDSMDIRGDEVRKW